MAKKIEVPTRTLSCQDVKGGNTDMPLLERYEASRDHPCGCAQNHGDFKRPLGWRIEDVAHHDFVECDSGTQNVELGDGEPGEVADVIDDGVASRRWRFVKRIVRQLINGVRNVDADFGAWCLHNPPALRA